jgi:hypothetical protein
MGAVPDVLLTDACIAVAPLSRPDTAAATIMVFKDCFIFVIPPSDCEDQDRAPLGEMGNAGRGTSRCGLDYIIYYALCHPTGLIFSAVYRMFMRRLM